MSRPVRRAIFLSVGLAAAAIVAGISAWALTSRSRPETTLKCRPGTVCATFPGSVTPRHTSPSAGPETPGHRVYSLPTSVPSDCSQEASFAILRWLATVPNHATARFGSGGCYLVNGMLRVIDRKGLVLDGNGSTFKRTRFLSIPDLPAAIWRFDGGSQLTVENMTITGTDPADAYDAAKAGEYAVAVYGVQTFLAAHITASHVWGDCLTASLDRRTPPFVAPANVTFFSSTCDSGRQGVSVITGTGYLISSNTFRG